MGFARLALCKSLAPLIQQQTSLLKIGRIPSISTVRSISITKPTEKQSEISNITNDHAESESLLTRIVKKLPFVDVNKYRLQTSGYILYELIADKIDYTEFFYEFSLPDTFYSWFVITELHVWMLLARCMAEGEEGRFVRNKIVEAMWADVSARAKQLGAHNPSGVRKQIMELSEQFHAALISYDEGIQDDDIVLAGAVWRRIFQMGEVDAEHLDALVRYIRRQMRLLDSVSREELFVQRQILWEKIKT